MAGSPHDVDLAKLLPLELYCHIFSFVSLKRDLCQLSLTSRMFNHETIPLIYRSVDLTISPKQLSLFADTLAMNQDARLMSIVRELAIKWWARRRRSLGPANTTITVFWETCGRILPLLHNLRVLAFNPGNSSNWEFGEVFSDCSFKLEALHTQSLDLKDVHSFLHHHPTIRHWTHQSPFLVRETSLRLHELILPNLRSLEADVEILAAIEGSRPLEQICLHYFDGDLNLDNSVLRNLGLFRETLVALTLDREFSEADIDCQDVIKFIAEQAPALERLSILDNVKPSAARQPTDTAVNRFVTSLAVLKRLQEFQYSPARWDTDSWWWRACAEGTLRVVVTFFDWNLSLRVVTFPTNGFQVEAYSDSIPAVSYSKAPGGDIKQTPVILNFRGDHW
ncbi:hypothetical protein JAAARDRAFT_61119 [Jaapia argillacea MUCL 33604]|uniref:F-box domain-containing protein n=1 Tax=Jaapia argillacea MUCL 33604 TaxID=933084 RepID=A0A067PTS0_9AGAM|nr:hypothetical protein JAAARDRAFT_61119 [Jaapia argillacea MUCL 33604]